jgi:hypothetical protein
MHEAPPTAGPSFSFGCVRSSPKVRVIFMGPKMFLRALYPCPRVTTWTKGAIKARGCSGNSFFYGPARN